MLNYAVIVFVSVLMLELMKVAMDIKFQIVWIFRFSMQIGQPEKNCYYWKVNKHEYIFYEYLNTSLHMFPPLFIYVKLSKSVVLETGR